MSKRRTKRRRAIRSVLGTGAEGRKLLAMAMQTRSLRARQSLHGGVNTREAWRLATRYAASLHGLELAEFWRFIHALNEARANAYDWPAIVKPTQPTPIRPEAWSTPSVIDLDEPDPRRDPRFIRRRVA